MRFLRWPLAIILSMALAALLISCGGGDDDDDDATDDDDDDLDDDDDDADGHVQDDPGVHTYIIVAGDPELEEAAMEIKALRHDEGFSVASTNLEALGASGDDQQKMAAVRDYLLSEYDSSIQQYVLLVGSHALIPMCMAYLDPLDHSPAGDYVTPTDFYYADMNSDWDADKDGFYGEYGEDVMDFTEELRTGRIPLDDPGAVAGVAGRIADFTGNAAPWKNNALLAAGRIRYEGDASLIMEIIRARTLDPAGYDVTTAYFDDNIAQPDLILSRDSFINFWAGNDLGFVMWASHGSATGAYTSHGGEAFVSVDDVDDLMGTAPSVVFSTACSNSDAFEQSLGHAMIESVAASFIGSTAVTHPGEIGEGSLTFLVTIDGFIVSGDTLSDSFIDGIDYYMDNFFLKMGYEPQLYLRNIYGFTIYGDPALVYRP